MNKIILALDFIISDIISSIAESISGIRIHFKHHWWEWLAAIIFIILTAGLIVALIFDCSASLKLSESHPIFTIMCKISFGILLSLLFWLFLLVWWQPIKWIRNYWKTATRRSSSNSYKTRVFKNAAKIKSDAMWDKESN